MFVMKKIIAVISLCAVLCAGVYMLPDAAVNAAPCADVVAARNVKYSETMTANGTLSFLSQSEVTSALPLVMADYCVAEGDFVEAGDVIARVDRDGSASLIQGLGQLPQLAAAASSLSTAVSLVPSEITADRSGRVVSVAGSGAAVESGSSICTIAGTDTLVLTAPVSEQYISSVRQGQPVSFTLTAYPDIVFTGEVAGIAAAARSRYSGSVLETVVDVTITPDEYDERLKSGLTAEVVFTLTDAKTICILPYEAIGQDEGGEYVFVYKDGKAVRRKIFTGAEFSDGTEVIKGVAAGELVFTSPDEISQSSFIRVSEAEQE